LWDQIVDFYRLGVMGNFPMVQHSPVTE